MWIARNNGCQGISKPKEQKESMTTICFIHDTRVIEDEASGLVLSPGFGYNIWQRYLEVFESVIVCTRMKRGGPQSGMGLSSGSNVEFLPADSYKGPFSLFFKLPAVYWQVTNAIRQADAVLLRLPSILGLIGYVAARRSNRPYIVELVGSPKDAYSLHGKLGRLIAPVMAAMTRRIVREAPYCVYVTGSYLQELYPTKGASVAISNVELDTSHQPTARKKPSAPFRIGSTGQVDVAYKGHSTLISALEHLPDVEFQVAGNGDPSKHLEHARETGVQDQVKFLGLLSRDELFEWLDTLDLYVQPSLTEGLPRAVLEAMSRGLPVIASNVGGLPELLGPEFLFEPGDSKTLSNKIYGLLQDEDYTHISASNYYRAREFDTATLQNRRRNFFSSFRDYVEGQKTAPR